MSGQKFGTSLSMNRALVYIKSVKLCVEATPNWASSKRTNKDYVTTVFSGIGANTSVHNSLISVVLKGFYVKKEKNLGEILDLGAVHVTLARWTNLAELVMQRRDEYSNPFKSVFITAHGTVLADIDPAKGVFYSTASTPMGKQFEDPLSAAC